MRIQDITNAERLILVRRRQRKSQRKVAKDFGVTLYSYRRWEDGEEPPPVVAVGKILPHEVCFLRRRRAGMSLEKLAGALRVSRWWACKMEYGRANPGRLIEHWAQNDKPWRPTPHLSRLASTKA